MTTQTNVTLGLAADSSAFLKRKSDRPSAGDERPSIDAEAVATLSRYESSEKTLRDRRREVFQRVVESSASSYTSSSLTDLGANS